MLEFVLPHTKRRAALSLMVAIDSSCCELRGQANGLLADLFIPLTWIRGQLCLRSVQFEKRRLTYI